MKKFVTLLIIAFCTSLASKAQTYLEHLQKKVPGKGTVTIRQRKEIDELVNGKSLPNAIKTPNQPATTKAEQKENKAPTKNTAPGKTESAVANQQENDPQKRKDT